MQTPNEPQGPLPLDYARAYGLSARRRSLFQAVGVRFVASCGIATLFAATILMMGRSHDYPVTLAFGGILVVIVQGALLAIVAALRKYWTGAFLEERNPLLTVAVGALGAVLVFGAPVAVAKVTKNEIVYDATTLIALVIYPLLASMVILRQCSLSPRGLPGGGGLR